MGSIASPPGESYLQNRRFEIYDGDPPLDDDFLDEFLDEEY